MTQKKGAAVKAGGAKAVAGGHNVAKGGFQKAKAGALQTKAFLGKKDLAPKGKVASPQVGKQQQKAGARGNQSPRGAKNGKAVPAKKGKVEEDEDDDDDEDDEDMDDDDEEMDDDDDDEELSADDAENSASKQKQTTPKSILKKNSNTPQADDEKVPKLVPIAAKATPKGNQPAATKKAADAKPKPNSENQKKSDDAFKLIANVDSEPLTAALRGEFETRVRRFANATVFVKGLHRRCTEDDLRKLVKDVITIRLPVHEKRGSRGARSRGYAFLEFKDEATARRNADFLNKEAKLLNSEGQASKLTASVSAAGGYVMSADDWNVGSLYVSGLPASATEEDLTKLFDRDQLVTVVLPRNRFTSTTRGCAHIRFRSAEASIQQFDAARAKLMRGEFTVKGQALTVAFSSRQTLKRERAEQASKGDQKPAAADKKVADKPANAPQNQTPKQAAAQGANSGASATKAVAKATPTNAANKSLNESVTKKGANDSVAKKQATPVQNSAQKGPTKRKLDEETARKAKVAKRDEEEDDDDEDEEDDDEDEDDDDEDDDE